MHYNDDNQLVIRDPTFCQINFDDSMTKDEKLIKVWYYAITTLSTIGFGDMSPISAQERLVACFILLIGVAVFSFIMG